jgi:hypothetical protein
MNERIGKLAEQAGLLGPSSRVGNSHEATERFTELIVRECMNIIAQNRKYASQHKWPAVELANVCLYEIDKTFGVQEDGKETVSS